MQLLSFLVFFFAISFGYSQKCGDRKPIGPCLFDQCPEGYTCLNPRSPQSLCCLKVLTNNDAATPPSKGCTSGF